MVKNYVRKTTRQSWNQDAMTVAIQHVLEGKMAVKTAAAAFNVPRSTLKNRVVKARTNKLTPQLASEKRMGRYDTVFSENLEYELVRYVLLMEGRLFGFTFVDVRRLAFELAEKNKLNHTFNQREKIAGKDWLYGFLGRHPEMGSPEKILPRAKGFNKIAVEKFYNLLESIYKNHKISPDDIYNVDETGILILPNKPSKILTVRGTRQIPTSYMTSPESIILVTVETCMSATGKFMPLMFVFPKLEENATSLDDVPSGSFTCYSKSGWIDREGFSMWFKRFVEFSKPSPDRPVLLLLDGLESHTKSLDVIQLACEKNVILLSFPPHTTNRLQPLDVSFVGALSAYYEQEVTQWLIAHPGEDVTVHQIGKLLNGAFTRAAVPETAVEGFRETGIYPFNGDLFPDHMFVPAETISAAAADQLESSVSGEAPDDEDSQPLPTDSGATKPQPSTSAGSSGQATRWLNPQLLLEQEMSLQQTTRQQDNNSSSNCNTTPNIHFFSSSK